MNRVLAQKWPFDDSCSDHINEEENERLMRGRDHFYSKFTSCILNNYVDM